MCDGFIQVRLYANYDVLEINEFYNYVFCRSSPHVVCVALMNILSLVVQGENVSLVINATRVKGWFQNVELPLKTKLTKLSVNPVNLGNSVTRMTVLLAMFVTSVLKMKK